jgi:LysR family transcriptional regulator, hydrogen peroxide-inducible genes activator
VLLKDGHCLSDQVLELCPKSKGTRRENFQTTSLETLRHLVASGAGYTLLPERAVSDSKILRSLITYLPIEGNVGRRVVLVSRKTYSRPLNVKALMELIEGNRKYSVD